MVKTLKRQKSYSAKREGKKLRRSSTLTIAGAKPLRYGRPQMGPEKKGYDTAITAGPLLATVTTAVDAFVLNIPRVGPNSYQRIGRKISLNSLRIRGEFVGQFDTSRATVEATVVRMFVVWDKHSNGGVAPSAIIGITDANGTETANVLDSVRYDQMERFTILRDVAVALTPPSGNTGGVGQTSLVSHHFDEFVDLKGLITTYDADDGGVADIASGGLQVYFRVTDVTGSAVYVRDCHARLRYYD